MRDIPVFTTEYGVASLIFKEIPYRAEAYIRIHDLQPGMIAPMLEECVGFCRAVGAEKVYAAGSDELETYPLHTAVYEMRGEARIDREKTANLFPATEQTVTCWREILNNRMLSVDNAGTLEKRDEKRILESGGAYFVHDGGELLGVGWMDGETLLTVASAVPGAGERVMHSLMSLAEGSMLTLEVASTNNRAIRLYEKLGFFKTREISRWYRVR